MANWLRLSAMSQWAETVLPGFQYDNISDRDITRALENRTLLQNVDPALDWEDDAWLLAQESISDDQKHAYRVASIVAALQSGNPMQFAIELDTFSMGQCCSAVPNGHHRIRALQYLGMDVAPFGLSGRMDLLISLLKVAGAEAPGVGAPARAWFTEELLTTSQEFDVLLEPTHHVWDVFDAALASKATARAKIRQNWSLRKLPVSYSSAGGVASYSHVLVSPDSSQLLRLTDSTLTQLGVSSPAPLLELSTKVYALEVGFADKDAVKAAGARWLSTEKRWCVKPADRISVLRWWPAEAEVFELIKLDEASS